MGYQLAWVLANSMNLYAESTETCQIFDVRCVHKVISAGYPARFLKAEVHTHDRLELNMPRLLTWHLSKSRWTIWMMDQVARPDRAA